MRDRRISIRVTDREFDRIASLSQEHGLSRTEYLIKLSTGELDDPVDLKARFEQIEQRIDRVERALFDD